MLLSKLSLEHLLKRLRHDHILDLVFFVAIIFSPLLVFAGFVFFSFSSASFFFSSSPASVFFSSSPASFSFSSSMGSLSFPLPSASFPFSSSTGFFSFLPPLLRWRFNFSEVRTFCACCSSLLCCSSRAFFAAFLLELCERCARKNILALSRFMIE